MMNTTPLPTKPEPFWNRLQDIMLYPVRGAAFVLLVTLTLFGLSAWLPGIGWILELLLWITAFRFAFEILRATSDGRMQMPEIALTVGNGTVWRFLLLQFALWLLVAFGFIFGGVLVGVILMLVIVLMQPGCIISLAIDGSFFHAIHPGTALRLMTRIGSPYFAVFGLLLVIQISAATAGDWLGQFMPPVFGALIADFFSLWGLFSAFHLMGYLVYQYHEELGYEPESHSTALPTLLTRDSTLQETAETLVREGNPDAALALLREDMRERAVGLGVHELYRRLLHASGDAAATEQHARQFIHVLLMEKNERRALGLLRESLSANPDFVPLEAEQGDLLAQRARALGQTQLAVDAWLALLRRFPKDRTWPRWALDAALQMSERLGRDAQARELLQQAKARCEDDAELRQKIDAALQALGN